MEIIIDLENGEKKKERKEKSKGVKFLMVCTAQEGRWINRRRNNFCWKEYGKRPVNQEVETANSRIWQLDGEVVFKKREKSFASLEVTGQR